MGQAINVHRIIPVHQIVIQMPIPVFSLRVYKIQAYAQITAAQSSQHQQLYVRQHRLNQLHTHRHLRPYQAHVMLTVRQIVIVQTT